MRRERKGSCHIMGSSLSAAGLAVMVDWLMVWGVTQAAGLVFKPILEDLAKESVKDYSKDFFKDCLKKVIRLPEKDAQKEAYGKALKEFLYLMQKELLEAGYEEAQVKEFVQPVKRFIAQRDVAAALGRSFEVDCRSIDTSLLAKTWRSMDLPYMPEDFDWTMLSKPYVRAVRRIIQESDKLRPFFVAQTQMEMAEGLRELVGIAPEFDLERYAEGLREQHGNLKLDSLDTTGAYYSELKLWSVFTPQNVRECHEFLPQAYEIPKEHVRRLQQSGQWDEAEMAEMELERYRKGYTEQLSRPVFEVVGDPNLAIGERRRSSQRHAVILGDPGSGKSTLLQYMALVWAERPVSELLLYPIPLLIELRSYARDKQLGKCQDMLAFIHSGNMTCRLNQQQLHDQLRRGEAIALFDGVDEIFDPALRDEVVTDIHRFTNDYPLVQVVATSRWLGYKAQPLRDAGFRHFMLQDLNDEQIQEFMQHWHDLTFVDEVEKGRKQGRLQRAIEESKAIRELAGNPLLLTMMAILNRHQELPRDRPELYNQASRVLLHQWDVERALVEDRRLDPKVIDYKDKQAMLRRVAYHMQSSAQGLAGNLISAADLEGILTDCLRSLEIDQPIMAARLMINQFRTRNFILCFLGADSYAFVHRTFLEYFCACELVERFQTKQTLTIEQLKLEVFGEHWRDEKWHEVLRLISGMIDAKFTGEIIDYLLAQDGEADKFSNVFLADECFLEVRSPAGIKEQGDRLVRRIKALSGYGNLEQAFQIADISLILPILEILQKSIQSIAKNWKEDPETLPWLKERVQLDENWVVRRVAVQAIAQGWKEDPETLPMLKERVQLDENWAVRSAAVQAVAQEWKEDPETLPWLKERVQLDVDRFVRSSAVEAIAQGWKEDSETLPMLKEQVQLLDEDGHVQRAAVQAIAQGWKEDPETLPWLKERVQLDENWAVRSAAVQAIAQGWKKDPEMLLMLKERVQLDENWAVRSAAVQAVAQGWKKDLEALPWLKERVLDEHWAVRSAAVQAIAQGWKDDPDLFELLHDRALHDPFEREEFWETNPRQTALQAIVENYPDHPQTTEALIDRADNDPDEQVKEFAQQQLAKLRERQS
jgi:predicted NACHT family NTPase